MQNLFLFKKAISLSLAINLVLCFSCNETSHSNTPDSNHIEISKKDISKLPKAANSLALKVNSALDTTNSKVDQTSLSSKYNLAKPNYICNLPKELLEISALSYDEFSNKLVTVNDEKANIYLLDIKNCEVADKQDFGKKGDYEGIEKVGQTTYVVNSKGDIYRINPSISDKSQIYKSPLSSSNDVEGLGYDKNKNELILACKGAPFLDKKTKVKKTKAFYSFNLSSKELDKTPKFVIKDKELATFFKKMKKKGLSKKAKKKLENRLESFSPSGIAKHPINNNYYVLSSVGKLLIVVDEQGEIQHIHFLESKTFSQPEGICFAPDGTLFISNEGRSLVAKILVFEYLL